MSAEVSSGIGMAVEVGGAVGLSATGGEIGAMSSLAAPSIGVDGGSLASGISAESLFSSTTEYSPSLASTPEMPLGNPGEIFSSSFSSLAEAPKSLAADMPAIKSQDVFSASDFEPYVPSIVSVPEMPVKINLQDEWLTLVQKPQEIELISDSISVSPQLEVSEEITDLQVEGLKTIVESSVADEKIQVLAEETMEQNSLSEKVMNLLVEEGVYTEVQARKRVGEIILQNKGLVEESIGGIMVEEKVEAGVKADPITEVKVQKEKNDTQRVQVETPEDEKDKNKPRVGKLPDRGHVLDEKAQDNRKKTIKDRISNIFSKARRDGLLKINSREIAAGLARKSENKSFLLSQLMVSTIPDGSLEEAARAVESLGDLEDVSEDYEKKIVGQVNQILEKNVPVKISNPSVNGVSDKDVKKVLKYAWSGGINYSSAK